MSHCLNCSKRLLKRTGAGVYVGELHTATALTLPAVSLGKATPRMIKGLRHSGNPSTHLANLTLEPYFKIAFGMFLAVKATCDLKRRVSLL